MHTLLEKIRGLGWRVAVHNDYRQNGEDFTFWLFTRGDLCAKGEARTDVEALDIVWRKVLHSGPKPCGCSTLSGDCIHDGGR